MANTTLTQTGAEVQSAINKAEKLPTVTGSDEGKTLQVDSSGNFVANTVSGGGSENFTFGRYKITQASTGGSEGYFYFFIKGYYDNYTKSYIQFEGTETLKFFEGETIFAFYGASNAENEALASGIVFDITAGVIKNSGTFANGHLYILLSDITTYNVD